MPRGMARKQSRNLGGRRTRNESSRCINNVSIAEELRDGHGFCKTIFNVLYNRVEQSEWQVAGIS
jgi:hypothetical protein